MTAIRTRPDSQNAKPKPVIRIIFDIADGRDDSGPRLVLLGRAGRWDWDASSWSPCPGDPLDGLTVTAWRYPAGDWNGRAVVFACPGLISLARAREIAGVLAPVDARLQHLRDQARRAGEPYPPPLHTWCSWVAETLSPGTANPFGVAAADCAGQIHRGYVGAEALGRWLERMTDRFRQARGWPPAAPAAS